ncbi:hypothetical protein SORBI_3002G284400 [Sorghum bicolor]|nr:hypothetical protein SORBI_3002G284400 [Sorghum bicolor]
MDVPGLHYDPALLLHGQQYMEIYRPIPSRANVANKIRIAGLHDRGKAAILEVETLTCLEGSGEALCMNRSTIYLRGAGGFSNSSQPFSYGTYPSNEVRDVTFPDSTPFAVYEDRTQKSQVYTPNNAWTVNAWIRRSSCHEVILQHGTNSRERYLLPVPAPCLPRGNSGY